MTELGSVPTANDEAALCNLSGAAGRGKAEGDVPTPVRLFLAGPALGS